MRALLLLMVALCIAGCIKLSTEPRFFDTAWPNGTWSGSITPANHGTGDARDLVITIYANRWVALAIADTAVQTTNAQVWSTEDLETLSRAALIDFDATVAGQPLHFHGYVAQCISCPSNIFGAAANPDSVVYDWWADGPY